MVQLLANKSTLERQDRFLTFIQWSKQNPDLKLTEHLWRDLKTTLHIQSGGSWEEVSGRTGQTDYIQVWERRFTVGGLKCRGSHLKNP